MGFYGQRSDGRHGRGGIASGAARSAAALALALGLALLAACGRTPTGGGPGTTGGGTTVTSGATTPTTSGATTSGAVTLTTGQGQYGPGDTIVVTIHNGTGGAVYAETVHTDCTVVQLDRQVNGSWQGQGGCVNGQPHPAVESIAPGADQQVQLAPGGTLGADSGTGDTTQWPAGTYRAALTYVTAADQPVVQGTTAYSASFTVA